MSRRRRAALLAGSPVVRSPVVRSPVVRSLVIWPLAALLLAGCSADDGGVADYADSGDGGYVQVSQSSSWYEPDGRGAAVDFTATEADGTTVSTAELRGQVVVLNFWYAGCPPCRSEAPTLAEVANEYTEGTVTFLGVNVRDDAATVEAFETSFEVPYPSVLDADSGDVQLALAETVPANATPATIVLDTRGRVAARMLGQLESAAQLSGYIDALLEEG
ncbi:MAG: TlpA disulfide reductase family protein [Microbacteriaceae bacterium]